jgi:hypothetical protein
LSCYSAAAALPLLHSAAITGPLQYCRHHPFHAIANLLCAIGVGNPLLNPPLLPCPLLPLPTNIASPLFMLCIVIIVTAIQCQAIAIGCGCRIYMHINTSRNCGCCTHTLTPCTLLLPTLPHHCLCCTLLSLLLPFDAKPLSSVADAEPCHRLLGVPGKERIRRTNKCSVICK